MGLVTRICHGADHRSRGHVRFATDNCREYGYVCTLKADVGPGQALQRKRKAAVGQLGGAVVATSAHFAPAKRCSHQVPAGKMASRPARCLSRASRYWSMKA
jgi:hypothetical protein